MSDTYDEMDAFVAKTKRQGGAQTSHNSDIPDQDMGRFADMAGEILKKNEPEHDHNDVFRQCDDNGICGG